MPRLCGSSLSQQGALVAEASYVQRLFSQLERCDGGTAWNGHGALGRVMAMVIYVNSYHFLSIRMFNELE